MSRPTDRVSAATDSADRQRRATEPQRQNATELRNAQLSVVSLEALVARRLRRARAPATLEVTEMRHLGNRLCDEHQQAIPKAD